MAVQQNQLIGLQYPLVSGPRGYLAQKVGIDVIKADLLQLLLTYPGERVMQPTFGTPLRDLMFEQNDTVLEMKAKTMIANSIAMWEPRIVLAKNGINVTSNFPASALNPSDDGSQREHILGIQILFYDPQNISAVQELLVETNISGI